MTLFFGKNPAIPDSRTFKFANYTLGLPTPPPTHDVISEVYANLKQPPQKLYPMDGNDQYGDCTIAALAHALTVYQGLIGKKKIMTAGSVERLYLKLTGGDDTGLDMKDVLNYWRHHSVSCDKILGYVSVDPHNHTQVEQAVELFGGVYLGFQVQENCIEEFDAGQPWTPGPLTQDGHAVYLAQYDPDGVTLLTWGATQRGTWAWLDETCDEAYAILPPEAKKPGFAPGFDFVQLQMDLKQL